MKIGEEVNNCAQNLIISCSLCLHSARRQKPILPLLIGGAIHKDDSVQNNNTDNNTNISQNNNTDNNTNTSV